jgi:processive 1,2-diacylglycerol beta-glucosyltransferase
MRRKHGLDEDRFAILVSAGGFGVGPVEHIIQALSGLSRPAQVVVVCGRNEELRARLTRVVPKLTKTSGVEFRLLGFTTEMDELMAASDLFVGKPGGLTTSEALSKGMPMVVINPIPGQEERNSDHLLEQGIAIRCNNLPALAYKIDRLIDEPGKLHLMRGNALALGKPQAAFTILDRLDTLRTTPVAEPVATPNARRKTSRRLAY